MVINKIDPLSVAKIFGVLYGCLGLVFGAVISLFVTVGGIAGGLANDSPAGAVFGLLFGAGAIIILPVFYGVMAAVMSAISAPIYNLVARSIGGIRIEVTPSTETPSR